MATTSRRIHVDENVLIGANAVIEDTVVFRMQRLVMCSSSRIIVGANVSIGPNTSIEGGNTEHTLGDEVHRDVMFGV